MYRVLEGTDISFSKYHKSSSQISKWFPIVKKVNPAHINRGDVISLDGLSQVKASNTPF